MTLFRGKYRIESARWPSWDYAGCGWYFVTICVDDRMRSLGKVMNGVMILSPAGEITKAELLRLARRHPEITLDAWMIMPDHLHVILGITNTRHRKDPVEKNASRLDAHSLGAAINLFKGKCTTRIRKILPEFAWQARFHDHVIRNDAELQRIRKYIAENPQKWEAKHRQSHSQSHTHTDAPPPSPQ